MLIQIAWRNVWRNKVRSLVVVIAVALGLWAGVFSDAFMQGMADQQIYSVIHTKTGHIQLNEPCFLQNHDLQLRMDHADSLTSEISAMPGVAAVSAILQQTSMASTSASSAGVMINAVDPDDQQKVSDLYTMMVAGSWFERSTRSNPIVIGQGLANKLKVKEKSRMVLTLQTDQGEIVYGAFKVVGIFKSQDSEYDKLTVFVRRQDLLPLIHLPESTATSITVLLNNTEDTEVKMAELNSRYKDLQIQSWTEITPMLQMMSSAMTLTNIIFVGIILIALAFGIINTMLMAVMDRTREIGMLASIGMKPGQIFWMIMLETVFLSITGAIFGLVASILMVNWFGRSGIDLGMLAEGINSVGFSTTVYPGLSTAMYAIIACMVVVIALIAGIFPARRAISLKPASAVRGE
ncbi:MAG: ABC transporter permease [Lewinellaceae bacterium]|nr:ABC transporter permease [Saprospiraceae bacterium]MCB9345014.1 ABC transporter permease [Lewinellaceae bacterium]